MNMTSCSTESNSTLIFNLFGEVFDMNDGVEKILGDDSNHSKRRVKIITDSSRFAFKDFIGLSMMPSAC